MVLLFLLLLCFESFFFESLDLWICLPLHIRMQYINVVFAQITIHCTKIKKNMILVERIFINTTNSY